MALGAFLELLALWRIGSKLDRMDRRQAEMMLADRAWPMLRIEPELNDLQEEPIFDLDEPVACAPSASAGPWRARHMPRLPAPEVSRLRLLIRWLGS